MRHAWTICLVGCYVSLGWAAAAEDLNVLPADPQNPPNRMLANCLARQAAAALQKRDAAYEKLKTTQDVEAYQVRLKQAFLQALGELPARCPLNGQVLAKIDRGDYRIEKVIFESQPRCFVSAIFYLPKTPPPYPGVIVPCGHSGNGKGYTSYQQASIILARNGIAALCYDPIGQGERHQVLKSDGKALMGTTTEHQAFSPACVLLGRNVATYRIWDGFRSLDYLASREEVDPKRLGCTGNSGGGTLTSYLMALDERIFAAAPSCYLTTYGKLLTTIGPQDAEQLIYGQLAFGMDHPDYMVMRAPRPTMILSATKDFFDIGGTWDAFRQAKRIYSRLGFGERVDLVEADAQHSYGPIQRVSMVRWMRRWLLGKDDAVTEPETPTLSDAEIQVTPRGEVLLLEGARSLTDLNIEYLDKLQKGREAIWKDRDKALLQVRRLAGIRPLAEIPQPKVRPAGTIQREGCQMEKLVLEVEDGIRLPALAFVPPAPTGQACLYLDGAGKGAQAGVGGELEKLAKAGQVVLAVDIRGLGELTAKPKHGHFDKLCGADWADVAVAYLLGRSYLGMRAEDVLVAGRFLAQYKAPAGKANAVNLLATGHAGVPALHASALEDKLFATVTLRDSLASFADVVKAGPALANQNPHIVQGALTVYDLPHLASVLGERLKTQSPVTAQTAAAAQPAKKP